MLSKLLRCLTFALISIVAIATTLGAQLAKPEKIKLEDLLAVEPIPVPIPSLRLD
jgi:hypothetical protein